MSKLYLALLYLIFPFIWVRLKWRARKAPAYARHWRERLGWVPFQLSADSIWIHATSLGETIAAIPVIQFLQKHYPHIPLVLTSMTPTGRAKAQTLQSAQTQVCYVPYDYPFAIKNFLQRARPRLALFMETELWPNILTLCGHRNIPFMLVNARMSAKSQRNYLRVAGFTRFMLQHIQCIAAQTPADAQRFMMMGAVKENVHVTGSLKFDLTLPEGLSTRATELRQAMGTTRRVWIAASTHEGEEKIVLQTFLTLKKTFPDLLLIVVPRHLERFTHVAQLCEQTQLKVVRRSQALPDATTDIYVGDTMGELLLLYAVADMAFVGGSLIPHGGQNPLEPAALGVPVVVGPQVFNFTEIVRLLAAAGALVQTTAGQLTSTLVACLQDANQRAEMGRQGRAVVEQNRGALQRQLMLLTQLVAEN